MQTEELDLVLSDLAKKAPWITRDMKTDDLNSVVALVTELKRIFDEYPKN